MQALFVDAEWSAKAQLKNRNELKPEERLIPGSTVRASSSRYVAGSASPSTSFSSTPCQVHRSVVPSCLATTTLTRNFLSLLAGLREANRDRLLPAFYLTALPPFPLFSVPRFRRRIARPTSLLAPMLYLRFFFLAIGSSIQKGAYRQKGLAQNVPPTRDSPSQDHAKVE